MKKIVAIALVLCMVFALCACGNSGGSSASSAKVVKIGVFEPQSGDNGAGGKQEILGMQYANKLTPTVEIGGETYQVELVYADNGSSTDKAPSAAQQLVSSGVSVVLGSYGSGVSIAGIHGINGFSPEETMRNMGLIASPGMEETEKTILEIINRKKTVLF